MLLDYGMPGDSAWATLRLIKTVSPHTRRIVLADNVRQQREVAMLAAEAVLLTGTPPGELAAVIERLMTGREPAGAVYTDS